MLRGLNLRLPSDIKKINNIIYGKALWAVLHDVGDISILCDSIGDTFYFDNNETSIIEVEIERQSRYNDDPNLPSNTQELSYHTDYLTYKYPPNFGLINCVKVDPEFPRKGANGLIDIQPVLSYIKNKRKSLYTHLKSHKYLSENFDRTEQFSILDDNDNLRFDSSLLSKKNDELKEFWCLCQTIGYSEKILLNSGETLIFNNHKTLHNRGQCSEPTSLGNARKVRIAHFNRTSETNSA